MRLYFDKGLYSKEALIKAAYVFIDNAYIYLSQNEDNFVVDIEKKDGSDECEACNEFKNEMLMQNARQMVYNNTKDIRKIILARAMASTMISESPKENDDTDTDVDEILSDWFEEK